MNLDMPTMDHILRWLQVVIYPVAFWLGRKFNKFEKKQEGFSKRLDDVESRLSKTETDLCNLPSKDDLHKIEIALVELGGDVKATRVLLEKVDITVDRRESILIQGDK